MKLADFGLSKGDLVREESDGGTPVKFYLADGQYTTVLLQRKTQGKPVIARFNYLLVLLFVSPSRS